MEKQAPDVARIIADFFATRWQSLETIK